MTDIKSELSALLHRIPAGHRDNFGVPEVMIRESDWRELLILSAKLMQREAALEKYVKAETARSMGFERSRAPDDYANHYVHGALWRKADEAWDELLAEGFEP